MKDCVFCKIANREASAELRFENADVLAFSPLEMLSKGHTLVVPRKHFENIFDIEMYDLGELIEVARNLSGHLARETGATGVSLLHASGKDAQQSVFHFHLHIVPRHAGDGLDLWPRARL